MLRLFPSVQADWVCNDSIDYFNMKPRRIALATTLAPIARCHRPVPGATVYRGIPAFDSAAHLPMLALGIETLSCDETPASPSTAHGRMILNRTHAPAHFPGWPCMRSTVASCLNSPRAITCDAWCRWHRRVLGDAGVKLADLTASPSRRAGRLPRPRTLVEQHCKRARLCARQAGDRRPSHGGPFALTAAGRSEA